MNLRPPPVMDNINELVAWCDELYKFLQYTAEIPIGSIIAWTTNTAPTGWLECDGSAVSRTTYVRLFAIISDDYGNGDGSTTFNLPDLRGEFLRGYDHGAGTDPNAGTRTNRGDGTTGDNVGTKQADENKAHRHFADDGLKFWVQDTGSPTYDMGAMNINTRLDNRTAASGGNEARPTNINVMWCIKI